MTPAGGDVEPAYTYVFVRTDLPAADQIVQVGHACLEAGSKFDQPKAPCHLVLFGISSEARLCEAAAWLEAAGIRSTAFFEPDDALGYTALCTEPVQGGTRRSLKRFKLWHQPGSAGITRIVHGSARAPPGGALLERKPQDLLIRSHSAELLNLYARGSTSQ